MTLRPWMLYLLLALGALAAASLLRQCHRPGVASTAIDLEEAVGRHLAAEALTLDPSARGALAVLNAEHRPNPIYTSRLHGLERALQRANRKAACAVEYVTVDALAEQQGRPSLTFDQLMQLADRHPEASVLVLMLPPPPLGPAQKQALATRHLSLLLAGVPRDQAARAVANGTAGAAIVFRTNGGLEQAADGLDPEEARFQREYDVLRPGSP